jgi:YVTN family beta-propeller protein
MTEHVQDRDERSASDVRLGSWMADVVPERIPTQVLEEAFARTGNARQLRRWPWVRLLTGPRSPLASRTQLAILGASLIVVSLAAMALSGGVPRPTPSPTPPESPSRPAAVAVVPVGSVGVVGPFGIATDGTSVWALGGSGVVSRIDPASGVITATTTLSPSTDEYQAIAADGVGVWITDWTTGRVVRLDPSSLTVIATIAVGQAPKGVVVDSTGVWVALTRGGAVVRIDASTNLVATSIPVGLAGLEGPNWLASRAGALWVGVPNTKSVYELDEARGAVTATIPVPGPAVPCGGLAIGVTAVWVTSCDNTQALARIDPNTRTVSILELDGLAYSVIIVNSRPWFATHTGQIPALTIEATNDLGSAIVAALVVTGGGPEAGDMVAAAGSIWLVDTPGNRILRLPIGAFE